MGLDLFEDFDQAAEANGWLSLGQPEQRTRRYGKGQLTIRVFSNQRGTAIVRANISRLGYTITALTPKHAAKRAIVLSWFEHQW